MRKRPKLRVIDGRKGEDESRIYRLRAGRAGESAAREIEWPSAGAWRQLVHRLMRTPADTK